MELADAKIWIFKYASLYEVFTNRVTYVGNKSSMYVDVKGNTVGGAHMVS